MSAVTGAAATTLTNRTLARRPDDATALAQARADHELEQLLNARYTAWKGHAPYSDQRPGLVAGSGWLSRCLHHHEGDELHRSWPQIVRGVGRRLGWPVDGLTVDELKRRGYISRVKRIVRYLEGMGLIDGWQPVYDERGESSGLRIRVAADARLHLRVTSPCSSTGAAARSRRRPAPPPRPEPRHPKPGPRRAFSEPTLHPPSGDTDHGGAPVDALLSAPPTAVPAPRAFGAEHGGGNGSGMTVGTAVGDPTANSAPPSTTAGEDGGAVAAGGAVEALRRRAVRAVVSVGDGDPLRAVVDELLAASSEGAAAFDVVLVGWELLRRLTGRSVDVRLRPARYRDAIVALDLADRYGNFGDGRSPRGPERGQPTAGAGLVLEWLFLAAVDDWRPLPITSRHRDREPALNAAAAGEVVSLAHFACAVGQLGRRWRAHHRARAGYNGARKGRRRGTARARRRRAG